MRKYTIALLLITACLVASVIVSCKSEFDKLLPSKDYSDSTDAVARSRKVLYLIVDGARGWSVRDAKAPNMSALLKNATYSWNSLSDSLGNNGNGWADLLTGVNKFKHRIVDDQLTGNKLDEYPTIIKRIKAADPAGLRLASFASSAVFQESLAAGADENKSFGNDADVRTAVINELKSKDAALIVGQFSAIDAAGKQSAYDLSSVEYKNAILKFDEYLGEILSALRTRKDYAKEDWLVIITSSHGGEATIPPAQDDKTIFSYPKANSFTILYNPSYKPYLITKPFTGNKYIGNFLRLYSNAATEAGSVFAKVRGTNSIYNLSDTISFTIELKLKKNIRAGSYTYSWPVFISKKDSSLTARTGLGWHIGLENNTWRFLLVNPTNVQFAINGGDILDGNWHSIAVVILNRDFNRVVRVYQDGKFVREAVVPATIGKINNNAPLRLGYIKTDNTHQFDGYLSDIRLWKAALTDNVINQFACDTRISDNHPYWGRLIGYWPGDDGAGNVLKDYSPAGNDFYITPGKDAALQWNSLSDITCPPATSNLASLVPRSVDIPRQILSWLTIPTPESWKLDGRVWINQ